MLSRFRGLAQGPSNGNPVVEFKMNGRNLFLSYVHVCMYRIMKSCLDTGVIVLRVNGLTQGPNKSRIAESGIKRQYPDFSY